MPVALKWLRRLGTLDKDMPCIDSDLTILICKTSSITHQTSGHGKVAKVVDRGYGISRRQNRELVARCGEESVSGHEQGRYPILRNGVEGCIEFAGSAGLQRHDAETNRARRLLDISLLVRNCRIVRVQQHAQRCGLWYYFPQ